MSDQGCPSELMPKIAVDVCMRVEFRRSLMRNFAFTLAAALVLTSWAPVVAADEQKTLKGEVVDALCYAERGFDKGTGPGHVECAKECAQKGHQFGVLTDGDGLYKIIGDYAANNYSRLVEFIGKQVEVEGTLTRNMDYSMAIKATKVRASSNKK